VATLPPPAGGNVYDKYGSRHPVERRLVRGFCDELERLAIDTGARDVHEVGCGEGELVLRLAIRGLRARGSDVSESVIDEARRRAARAQLDVSFRAAPIEVLDPSEDAAELVLCCEVMEHLDDPEAGLEIIARLARPWAIVSVPREPLWRLLNLGRLKYVRDLGNTPGHLQHWSKHSFLHFLERRLEIVAVRNPVPWTMALCRST
jgi:2-polyprenyl-3-methyl-5-hydroxy-6-metoxy-1,4-benzoquinol methylase